MEVLRDISLEVRAGEAVAIVGPSGSGKSTLLNLLGALDGPDSGEVRIGGQDLAKLNEEELALARNQQIGFIFQSHHLLPHCNALENVLIPTLAGETGHPGPDTEERARKLLARVGLQDRMHHRPDQLSGGERQRVAVVRAMINQPALLLADEPTGALDRDNAENLAALLAELNREEHTALIVVTHALDLARKMDRVLELREGRLNPVSE